MLYRFAGGSHATRRVLLACQQTFGGGDVAITLDAAICTFHHGRPQESLTLCRMNVTCHHPTIWYDYFVQNGGVDGS